MIFSFIFRSTIVDKQPVSFLVSYISIAQAVCHIVVGEHCGVDAILVRDIFFEDKKDGIMSK